MNRAAPFFVIFGLAASSQSYAAGPQPVPVLLELFTSEGCSSCPPADDFLKELDRSQPFAGVDLIVIGEHVDYWNKLGWIDQNSSRLFSQRQSGYADRLKLESVYTPQLLVDGAYAVSGGDRRAAGNAIVSAERAPKIPILLTAEKADNAAEIHISIDSIPSNGHPDVYVALAAERASSKVTAGENSGRQLTHVAVAFSFQKIGTLESESFSKTYHARLNDKAQTGLRVIVLIQDRKTGHILGVAQTKI